MPRARRAIGLLAAVLVLGLVAPSATDAHRGTAITPGIVDRTSINLEAVYAIDLAVRYGDRAVRMDTRIAIVNRSGGPIDRLELNTVAAALGNLRLDRVSVDGRIVTADVDVDDQTLIVPLGGVLVDGDGATVRVIYHATLRSTTAGSNWLFTRANGVVELYRAIPWISRRHPFDRGNHGDPFVTPTSQLVTLKLTTDRAMVVALNGTRTSVSANGRVQTFEARDVRDLPLAMAPDFRVSMGRIGDTTVRVYGRPGAPFATLLANARRSIDRMEDLVGPYPWPTLTIVQSAGGYAMEGPGTIWIPRTAAASSLVYLVAHETAHQWFPGLVGNDQWSDPWVDEGVADMIARTAINSRRSSRCSTDVFDRPITGYSGACYYEVIYIQGGNWLDGVRREMGSGTFWAAMRQYIDERRFGMGSSRELLETLDAASPVDVAAMAASRFPTIY